MNTRRVAFFTDSFHEVNGVALTSREFVGFAQRRGLPLLSVHAGPQNKIIQNDSVTTFEFVRGPVSWHLEHDLAIDFLFWRHRARLRAALAEFQPDLVHITGPGDAGVMGLLAAYELKIPLAASWHTNLHEFAATRLANALRLLPQRARAAVESHTESITLKLLMRFYRLAKVLYAPNPELVEMLEQRTRRPAFLMGRGIDLNLFSPSRRRRTDETFVIGYVGRLSPEKSVRMLAELDQALRRCGVDNFRFLIVGAGSESGWLRANLPQAEMPGILRGEPLANAYASMDAFVFPSRTDTFGNVVLEAMASGVPAIVAASGGPKFLVQAGKTGYVAETAGEFAAAVAKLHRDRQVRTAISGAAREAAKRFSWDRVIGEVYENYDACFPALTEVPAYGRPIMQR